MRQYSEPTCKHLFRQPLILGVSLGSLLLVMGTTLGLSFLSMNDQKKLAASFGISGSLYLGLLLLTRYGRKGWGELALYHFDALTSFKKDPTRQFTFSPSTIEILNPDTLDEDSLISCKLLVEDRLRGIGVGQRKTFVLRMSTPGAELSEFSAVQTCETLRDSESTSRLLQNLAGFSEIHAYSLTQIPLQTDPLWLFSIIRDLKGDFQVWVSFSGLDQNRTKRQVESILRIHSHIRGAERIDSEVAIEAATHVLRGLSRGDEKIIEMSLVIVGPQALPLDTEYFFKEKNVALTLLAVSGLRKNQFRSHRVRTSTASDLFPNLFDPREAGTAILQTLRDHPLYFDPQDSRLDALHWLVVGATGTGKSFFTGTILWRMIREGRPISVLFIDHKRSFKRVVLHHHGIWIEPTNLASTEAELPQVLCSLNQPGFLSGIELAEMTITDKQKAASFVLRSLRNFLNTRTSAHAIYIVMDECWKFLKDDPNGVQEAFREFRKYDAGVIAITQSLKDFISDTSGQSIIQNAEINILLRQKEDVRRYQDILDLNETEILRVKSIKKEKGLYSECLIKTPYCSRFGRLYPTEEEHDILRTDNLRSERTQVKAESRPESPYQTPEISMEGPCI